jgi:hypothetical protein
MKLPLPTDALFSAKGGGSITIRDVTVPVMFSILHTRDGTLTVELPNVQNSTAKELHKRDNQLLHNVIIEEQKTGVRYVAKDSLLIFTRAAYGTRNYTDFKLVPSRIAIIPRKDSTGKCRKVVFAITNMEFWNDESVQIDGGQHGRISFRPLKNYKSIWSSVQKLGYPQQTGWAICERERPYTHLEIARLRRRMLNYLLLLSLAQGRDIQWLTYGCGQNKTFMLRHTSVMKIRHPFSCIIQRQISQLLEDCMGTFESRKHTTALVPAINLYLSSLHSHFWQSQCISMYTGLEWLKAHFHKELVPEYVLPQNLFDELLPALKEAVTNVLESRSRQRELSVVSKGLRRCKKEILLNNLQGIHRYSFKDSLRMLFEHYRVPYEDILPNARAFREFIDMRNKLIHRGTQDCEPRMIEETGRKGRALMLRTILAIIGYRGRFCDPFNYQSRTLTDDDRQ